MPTFEKSEYSGRLAQTKARMEANGIEVLEPNMTIHMIPGVWFDDWGIEISECVHVTETGAAPLADFPRKLFVKN